MTKPIFALIWWIVGWAAWNGHRRLEAAILNHICPYPIEGNYTIRACNKAGNCGCNNGRQDSPL